MYLLSPIETPALDCEAEVMVDLMELASTYIEWYRSHDGYVVRAIDTRNWDKKSNAGVAVTTSEAQDPMSALKGAFASWSKR